MNQSQASQPQFTQPQTNQPQVNQPQQQFYQSQNIHRQSFNGLNPGGFSTNPVQQPQTFPQQNNLYGQQAPSNYGMQGNQFGMGGYQQQPAVQPNLYNQSYQQPMI